MTTPRGVLLPVQGVKPDGRSAASKKANIIQPIAAKEVARLFHGVPVSPGPTVPPSPVGPSAPSVPPEFASHFTSPEVAAQYYHPPQQPGFLDRLSNIGPLGVAIGAGEQVVNQFRGGGAFTDQPSFARQLGRTLLGARSPEDLQAQSEGRANLGNALAFTPIHEANAAFQAAGTALGAARQIVPGLAERGLRGIPQATGEAVQGVGRDVLGVQPPTTEIAARRFKAPSVIAPTGQPAGTPARVGGVAEGKPPVEPPVATGAVPPEGQPPGNPVEKIIKLIKAAKPPQPAQEAAYSAERAKRLAVSRALASKATTPEELLKSHGALGGTLPRVSFTAPNVGLEKSEIWDLYEMTRAAKLRGFEHIQAETALTDVLAGALPVRSQIAILEKVFGSEFAQALLSKRGLGERAFEEVMSTLGIPRLLQTIADWSAPLRQGFLLAGEPGPQARAWTKMFEVTFSEKNYASLEAAIQSHPHYDKLVDAGIYLAPMNVSATLGAREEAFASRTLQRLPGFKQVIRGSERAYVGYLNKLRSDVFYQYVNALGERGTPERLRSVATFINQASGRGSLGKFEGAAYEIAQVLYSPRFLVSRFQAPAQMLNSDPVVRNIAIKNVVAAVGVGVTTLALLKGSGVATVQLNPLSGDFGKARIGKTRLDFFAGYLPLARTIARIWTGKTVTQAGIERKVKRNEVAGYFAETKLAPTPEFILSVGRGSNIVGDTVELTPKSVGNLAFNYLVPMSTQDILDAINESGLLGGLIAAPSVFGVGVQTYGKPKFDYGNSTPAPTTPAKATPQPVQRQSVPMQPISPSDLRRQLVPAGAR